MTRYLAELRYYPGDPLEDIKNSDLKTLEKEYGVVISCAKTENREMKDGLLMERTLDKRIEDITQEVITVASDQEENFSKCLVALYKKYRCPRTPYGLLGSNEAGQKIAKKLMDKHGGW
jgi:hypothetical protein